MVSRKTNSSVAKGLHISGVLSSPFQSTWLAVTSPLPSARMARIGAESLAAAITKFPADTGDGATSPCEPLTRHNSLPSAGS